MIARTVAFRAAVGDVQTSAAVPAPEQAGQQCLAAADRATGLQPSAVGIVGIRRWFPSHSAQVMYPS